MKYFKFKTNINCGGCVANVMPFLDKAEGIYEWNVDTTNALKLLNVSTDELREAEIISIVQKAGYKAECL